MHFLKYKVGQKLLTHFKTQLKKNSSNWRMGHCLDETSYDRKFCLTNKTTYRWRYSFEIAKPSAKHSK